MDIKPDNARGDDAFGVMLPCTPDQFNQFISGLLGKPQTIDQHLVGSFEINSQTVLNIHNLIQQRITQQNSGKLIQFTSRIVFDDNSSVLLNSIEDFQNHHEIKPIVSTQLHLSWVYLIQFQDKLVPEKQLIDLTFIMPSDRHVVQTSDRVMLPDYFYVKSGNVFFRIQHTARTWGTDIQSLLVNHLSNIVIEEKWYKTYIRRNSGKISFTIFVFLMLSTFYSIYTSAKYLLNIETSQLANAKKLTLAIDKKIDLMLNYIYSNPWDRFLLASLAIIFTAFFISILAAILIESSTDTTEPSFILLTDKSIENKNKILSKNRFKVLTSIGSIILSVITGVIGNIVYSNYWQ